MARNSVSAELFVETWRDCDSADEVAEALMMTKSAVTGRAANYRKLGVELKKMPRAGGGKGSRLDIDRLNAISQSQGDSGGTDNSD